MSMATGSKVTIGGWPKGENVQAMSVRLSEEALTQLTSGENMSIVFGTENVIKLGAKAFTFSMVSESVPHEVFRQEKGKLAPIGSISHRVSVKRDFATINTEKIKSRTEEAERERHARSVVQVDAATGPKKKGRPTQLQSTKVLPLPPMRSAPSSPFLAPVASSPKPRNSPHHVPLPYHSPLLVASPKPSGAPSLRIRLCQLLALGPATEAQLIKRTKAAAADVTSTLKEVAVRDGTGWKLADKSFNEVKIWDWKYYSPHERQSVIESAGTAFDRLDLPEDAPERRALAKPGERRSGSDRSDTPPLTIGSSATNSSSSTSSMASNLAAEDAKKRVRGGIVKTANSKRKADGKSSTAAEPNRKRAKIKEKLDYTTSDDDSEIGLGIRNVGAAQQAKSTASSSTSSSPTKPVQPSASRQPQLQSVGATEAGSTLQTPSATPVQKEKPEPKPLGKQDMFELARKFKERHAVYAKLYNEVKNAQQDPARNGAYQGMYDQLMRMHNELGQWKSALYASSTRV